uniref:Uncharacterized protein n=1 Tax=Anopheles atroparvus TaxID=41427 RepID=A0A182IXY9_ANOAO
MSSSVHRIDVECHPLLTLVRSLQSGVLHSKVQAPEKCATQLSSVGKRQFGSRAARFSVQVFQNSYLREACFQCNSIVLSQTCPTDNDAADDKDAVKSVDDDDDDDGSFGDAAAAAGVGCYSNYITTISLGIDWFNQSAFPPVPVMVAAAATAAVGSEMEQLFLMMPHDDRAEQQQAATVENLVAIISIAIIINIIFNALR